MWFLAWDKRGKGGREADMLERVKGLEGLRVPPCPRGQTHRPLGNTQIAGGQAGGQGKEFFQVSPGKQGGDSIIGTVTSPLEPDT